MRIFLAVALLGATLFGAKVVEVDEMYQKSVSCKPCHLKIVQDWENSWHSKSHYQNDEYFQATVDYVKRKTRKSLNSIKIECATCHNPRVSVTSTSADYEIRAMMQLNKDSKVDKALEDDALSEGINCVVCHNIDKIHVNADQSKRGFNRVEWTKSGLMSGPFSDAHSPYHKTEARDFMNDKADNLCFVCHANDSSHSGLVFTNMEKEYKKDGKMCVDCHMGEKKMGVAATLRIEDGKAKPRMVREHKFQGGHVESMWKGALGLEIADNSDNTLITINNPQPHNIPSGFGSRELILVLTYFNGDKEINSKSISFTNHYKSKRGKATIPHLAVEASEESSIPAKGKKVVKVSKQANATTLKVDLYYRLVNDEVRKILKLEGEQWSKKSLISSKTINLK